MKSVRLTMRLLLQTLIFVILIVGCRYDKVNEITPTTDELSIADAQKAYEAEMANLRVATKKTPLWTHAKNSTFADGTPLISVPMKVEGPVRLKFLKDGNGKPEKILLPSPILISYKDKKTGKYLYKEVQAVPKKGTVTNNGKGQLKNFKGLVYVSTLDGKLETIFDVTNGKYKVSRASTQKNARVSSSYFMIYTFHATCDNNYYTTYDLYVYSNGTYIPMEYPHEEPSDLLNPGISCESWIPDGSYGPFFEFSDPPATPDPIVDPSTSQPISVPIDEPEEDACDLVHKDPQAGAVGQQLLVDVQSGFGALTAPAVPGGIQIYAMMAGCNVYGFLSDADGSVTRRGSYTASTGHLGGCAFGGFTPTNNTVNTVAVVGKCGDETVVDVQSIHGGNIIIDISGNFSVTAIGTFGLTVKLTQSFGEPLGWLRTGKP